MIVKGLKPSSIVTLPNSDPNVKWINVRVRADDNEHLAVYLRCPPEVVLIDKTESNMKNLENVLGMKR